MNYFEEIIDLSDTDSSELYVDSGAERFSDEYMPFEFEAMTLVPYALTAFVSHQQTYEL